MNPSLIELHDHNLSVRDASGILAQSPGFASIAGKQPLFGDSARQQARLHPRHSLNQFWGQLSLDPLLVKTPHFRHSADIAHKHLEHLTANLDLREGAVLAVPSNYTRSHLAVLLGVVKQCAFAPVGLIDQSLLQAAGTPGDECIVIDLQLHQAVLTRFRKVDGMLVKDAIVQVPASGMQALQDAWTNMITDEFLRQCRFDPKHNAETEQYLYNQLDSWIQRCRQAPELIVEINHQGSLHQARLTIDHFNARSTAVFRRILKELDTMRGAQTALHVRSSTVGLPGLAQTLPGVIAVDEDLLVTQCVTNLDAIKRPTDSLQFITRLPLNIPVGTTASSAAVPQRLPTHVLFEHRAIPLPLGSLAFGQAPAPAEVARLLPVPASSMSGHVIVNRQARQVVLELLTPDPVLCNGTAATNGMTLALGDNLQLGNARTILQLIQVE
mgnify:CR=1 FL=1